jgi:hypothetical protein
VVPFPFSSGRITGVFETAQLLGLSEDQMHFRAVAWDKQLPWLGMVETRPIKIW